MAYRLRRRSGDECACIKPPRCSALIERQHNVAAGQEVIVAAEVQRESALESPEPRHFPTTEEPVHYRIHIVQELTIAPEWQLINVGGGKPVRHVLIRNHAR